MLSLVLAFAFCDRWGFCACVSSSFLSPPRRPNASETQTFEYDAVGRLTSAKGTGTGSYDFTYTYGNGGNLATRVNNVSAQTRTYTYGTPAQHHAHAVTAISGSMAAAYTYDNNGNMITQTESLGTFTQTFDAENRLINVTKEAGANDLIVEFYYDADGNRILAIYKSGATETSRVYTPFPDYEETTSGGSTTKRVSFSIAGQLIAVRVITDASNAYYYVYADHLGSTAAWTNSGGTYVPSSLACFDLFGN